MITLEDCIGLCGLTEEEVLAIAEHEHLPEIAATALAQYLLCHEHGSERVRDMIVDDIRQAESAGDKAHTLTLLHVLHHFLKTHPEAKPAQHPWSGRVRIRLSVLSAPRASAGGMHLASRECGAAVTNGATAFPLPFVGRDRERGKQQAQLLFSYQRSTDAQNAAGLFRVFA
jgi:hypothetical protein